MLIIAHLLRGRLTMTLESWKIPEVGKAPALVRFDGLNATVEPIEKNAFMIGPLDQGQTAAVVSKASEFLDECFHPFAEEGGNTFRLLFRDLNFPGPPAAGRASITMVEDGHAGGAFGNGSFRVPRYGASWILTRASFFNRSR